jgi:hypothetical protein
VILLHNLSLCGTHQHVGPFFGLLAGILRFDVEPLLVISDVNDVG